jgi:hypothetical protein
MVTAETDEIGPARPMDMDMITHGGESSDNISVWSDTKMPTCADSDSAFDLSSVEDIDASSEDFSDEEDVHGISTQKNLLWGGLDDGTESVQAFEQEMRQKDAELEIIRESRRTLEDNWEEEDEDTRNAAEFLYPLIKSSWFQGCDRGEHDDAITKCRKGQECHDLSITYSKWSLDDTNRDIGIRAKGFPNKTGTGKLYYPKPIELKKAFEGKCQKTDRTPRVCLHREEEIRVDREDAENLTSELPELEYDTDSYIAKISSLAGFREVFKYCPLHTVHRNLQSGLHFPIQLSFYKENGELQKKEIFIDEIPHQYVGTIRGWDPSPVFLAFPALWDEDRKKGDRTRTFLTKEQAALLYNRVWKPALYVGMTRKDFNRLPSSYESVETKAHSLDNGTSSRKIQLLHYDTLPSHHKDIWDTMEMLIEGDVENLGQFRGMFLFFDVKNIKSRYGSYDLYQSMEKFDEDLSQALDYRYIEEAASDIGSSISPLSPDPNTRARRQIPPVVYKNRRCCVIKNYNYFKEHGFGGKAGNFSFYTSNNLYDTLSITLEPPKLSMLKKGGHLYMQQYDDSKVIHESSGAHPWQNEKLAHLAVGKEIYESAIASSRSSHKRSWARLTAIWEADKNTILTHCQDPSLLSYGVRFEIRITSKLRRAIKRRAKRDFSSRSQLSLTERPTSVWILGTASYLQFLLGNYNKYISLIEMCGATIPSPRLDAHIVFIQVLIECLRRFQNAELKRYPALWCYKKELDGGKAQYGLGFERSISKYGYCWFRQGIVDWEELTFHRNLHYTMIPGYNKNPLPFYDLKAMDSNHILQEYVWYLPSAKQEGYLETKLFQLLAHNCFRRWRLDILDKFKSNLRQEAQDDIKEDKLLFTAQNLIAAFTIELELISGPKTRLKTPEAMFDFIWTDNTQIGGKDITREKSDKCFYRELYRNTDEIIRKGSPMAFERWRQILYNEFWTYHWVVPYPNITNGSLKSMKYKGNKLDPTKKRDIRQLWAVRPFGDGKFEWARDCVLEGTPSIYPVACLFRGEDLQKYFRDCMRLDIRRNKLVR